MLYFNATAMGTNCLLQSYCYGYYQSYYQSYYNPPSILPFQAYSILSNPTTRASYDALHLFTVYETITSLPFTCRCGFELEMTEEMKEIESEPIESTPSTPFPLLIQCEWCSLVYSVEF